MQPLVLTKEHLKKMIAHVDSQAPLEACGLLVGLNSKVETVLTVTNQAQSEVRYVMDPIEQLNAFEWIESNGLNLLGIFHSHPTGPETVSPTDIAASAYEVVYVILARMNDTQSWRARGFWIKDGTYNEVTLQVI
jgi:proteasome lid subunit RPN8/RPN11